VPGFSPRLRRGNSPRHNTHAGGQAFQFGKWSFEEWKKRGQDQHSLVIDPMFVDPENADFTLKPGSLASQIDFHAINLGEVGPRR